MPSRPTANDSALGELSERMFHESTTLGIGIVSTDLRFVRVNPAFCRISGYAREELVGAPIADVTCPQACEAGSGLAGKVIRREIRRRQIERRLVRKDGGLVRVLLLASETFGEDGERFGIALLEDATTRKGRGGRLPRRDELFRLIAEEARDIISIADASGKIAHVSSAVEKILGYAPGDLIGRSLWPFVHADDREAVEAATRKAAADPDRGVEVTFRCRHRDGRDVWLESAVRETADLATGAKVRIAVSRDVTARKKTEQVRDDLVAMVAHDIRNPISTILGITEILREEAPGQEVAELLARLEGAAHQAARLASNFLDGARVENGALRPERSSTSVNALVEATLRDQESAARSRNVRVETRLDAGLAPLPLDPALIGRALTNLVSNAVKFSPPAGVVRVRTERRGDHTRIEVEDEGPGITPEERVHLFERYGTVHGRVDSIGLGLFIVREIVEAHGGRVAARFPAKGGSQFEISLPNEQSPISTFDDPVSSTRDSAWKLRLVTAGR